MTTSADFEERWKAACVEVQGKQKGLTGHRRQDSRMVRKSVVAKVVAMGARVLQYNTMMWKMVRQETREAREQDHSGGGQGDAAYEGRHDH